MLVLMTLDGSKIAIVLAAVCRSRRARLLLPACSMGRPAQLWKWRQCTCPACCCRDETTGASSRAFTVEADEDLRIDASSLVRAYEKRWCTHWVRPAASSLPHDAPIERCGARTYARACTRLDKIHSRTSPLSMLGGWGEACQRSIERDPFTSPCCGAVVHCCT